MACPRPSRGRTATPTRGKTKQKRLLAEAGFGPGGEKLVVEIRFNNSENHRATAVAIADMWKAVGVESRLLATDATTHYAFLREKPSFDVARSGWFADYPDAQNFLFLGQSDNQALNAASFTNKTYDRLMHEAQVKGLSERRRAILHQAEALLLDEQPDLVLLHLQVPQSCLAEATRAGRTNVRDNHPGRYISIAP